MLVACGERAELDRRMEELCKKDGGIRIYETVVLPQEAFDQNNNVLQSTVNGNPHETVIAEAYASTFQLTVIKDGDPLKGEGLLHRRHLKIVRIKDGKVLAESVEYVRAGGDRLQLGHHSTAMCPIANGGLIPRVFAKDLK